jgi:L-threonylcarbamoyladenylate synthase
MEQLRLTSENVEKAAERAAAVLRAGGVVLYPTDTLYGLGADAFSDEAVAKVYAIKGRDVKKPIHAIVADIAMMEQYAEVNDAARALADTFLPGPLTLVLKKKTEFNSGIAKNIGTIGFRIPRNDFCLALAKIFGAPFTTTSANKAGEETRQTVEAVLEQIGDAGIELAIDAGELPSSKPSTVVDLSGAEPRVVREGAIPADLLYSTLGKERV